MLKVAGYNNSVATPSTIESLILKQIDLSGINTDFAWKSLILAQFSAEPLRGELFGFDTSHAIFSWSNWQPKSNFSSRRSS